MQLANHTLTDHHCPHCFICFNDISRGHETRFSASALASLEFQIMNMQGKRLDGGDPWLSMLIVQPAPGSSSQSRYLGGVLTTS